MDILFPPAPCKGSHKQNTSSGALQPLYCQLGTGGLGLFWLLEIGATLSPPPQGQIAFKHGEQP